MAFYKPLFKIYPLYFVFESCSNVIYSIFSFFPYHWLLLYTLKLAGIFIILQKKWFFSTLPSPEDKAQQTLWEVRAALCADSSGIPVVKSSSVSVLVLFYFLDKRDHWSLSLNWNVSLLSFSETFSQSFGWLILHRGADCALLSLRVAPGVHVLLPRFTPHLSADDSQISRSEHLSSA